MTAGAAPPLLELFQTTGARGREPLEPMMKGLDAFRAALLPRDTQQFADCTNSFAALMAAHGAKEENILFPRRWFWIGSLSDPSPTDRRVRLSGPGRVPPRTLRLPPQVLPAAGPDRTV